MNLKQILLQISNFVFLFNFHAWIENRKSKKLLSIITILFLSIYGLNASPNTLRDEPGTIDWLFETNDHIHKSFPAIDSSGNIYFGNMNDSLYSISSEGELNWTFPTGSIIMASPAILPDGRICFGGYDHNFYMLNNDGLLSWSFDAGASIEKPAAVRYDGVIYFVTNSDVLYALDFNGNFLWSRNMPGEIQQSPVLGSDGTIYIIASYSLYALNENGATKWHNECSPSSHPVIDADRIYYFNERFFKAVDLNGDYIWAVNLENYNSNYSTPAIGKKGNIYFGTFTGRFRAYNRNGVPLWNTIDTGSSIKTGPLLDNAGNIFYADSDDNFYSISTDGQHNWNFQADGTIISPNITSEGKLIFGSYDGTLYCINGYESELSRYASPMHGVERARTFSYYSNIYTSKNRIAFDYTFVNSTEEDTLIIYNNTDETVQIYLEYDAGVFQVNSPFNQIAPEDSLALIISFQPTAEEIYEFNLKIFTDDVNAPARNIYLYGNGVHLDAGEMVWNMLFDSDKMSSPIMDDDGIIYLVSDGDLLAVNENQQILWSYHIGSSPGSYIAQPVMTPDNKILAVSTNGKLYCVDNNGNLEWIYETESDFHDPPAVDLQGNIFVINRNNLISLTAEAEERWIYDFGNIQVGSSPSISADGTIYFSNSNSQLIAVTKNGLHKFTFEGEEYFNQPVIDEDGTIYITAQGNGSSIFYAINADGSLLHTHNQSGYLKSPAIIGIDNIYYASCINGESRIYSYDKETFSQQWASQLISGTCLYSPTLASDGSLFITSWLNFTYSSYLTAINSQGNIKWIFDPYEYEFTCKAYQTPLIDNNGNIIMSSWGDDTRLFAISENVRLANSSWATLGQNAIHSSMAKNSIIPGPDIIIDNDDFDFGIVESGNSENMSVTVYNEGDSLLVFSHQIDGDGFFVPNLRNTLLPGDNTNIEIIFAPEENEDPIHHGTLTIYSNDCDQPIITISLFGKSNLEGSLKWKIQLRNELECTPAVDDFGNIYIFDSDLFCLGADGEIKWILDDFGSRYFYCSNVTISDDNSTIYFPAMRAADSTGVLLFNTPVYNGNFTTPIALDANEQLYFGNWKSDGSGLFAFNNNGEPLWDYTDTQKVYASPIIDPEGNIYFISTSSSDNGAIISFDSDGNMNWSEAGNFYRYSLALGFDNKLFALDWICPGMGDIRTILKCFDTEGNFYWEFVVPNSGYGYPATSPIIDEQGNIYFANTSGELYSINPNGNMNWYYEFHEGIQSTPAVCANGVIYIGYNNGVLYAVNSDGTLRWEYQTESEINDHIVVTDDEMIYFTNESGYLYAIHGLNGGLADSPWPMIHQNPKHNCRLDEYFISSSDDDIVQTDFRLINYPNPFNPSTTISFELTAKDAKNAKLIIYNLKGQKVKSFLINQLPNSPINEIIWDGTDSNNKSVSTGIYFYKLIVDNKTVASNKCLLLK